MFFSFHETFLLLSYPGHMPRDRRVGSQRLERVEPFGQVISSYSLCTPLWHRRHSQMPDASAAFEKFLRKNARLWTFFGVR